MILFLFSLVHLFTAVYSDPPLWIQGDAVGKKCYIKSDCETHDARCIRGQCVCLSTQVNVKGRCLPKIKPGQSPCSEDAQCQAAWPDTRCLNTICQCTRGIHVLTRDGIVCVEQDSCPLGGKDAVLRDGNGGIAECYVGPSGYMSGCLGQLHMYDCIRDRNNETHFYCCPSKANVCNQPKDEGSMEPELADTQVYRRQRIPWYLQTRKEHTQNLTNRWHFNHLLGQCQGFYYKGREGNANNFQRKDHCENYCRSTCAIGSPMFQKGPDGRVNQFLQRQQMCNPQVGCGDPQFQCDILQPGKALCCPTTAFICGNLGGLPQRKLNQSFDEGIFCGAKKIFLSRWYFNAANQSCEPFQYKGCSGNYNNFLSKNHCELVCLKKTDNPQKKLTK